MVGGGILTWIFVTDGIADIAFRMTGELQPLYLEQIGRNRRGTDRSDCGSINAIASMFVPMLSGKLVDKHGERLPLITGFALDSSVAFIIFLQADSFLTFAGQCGLFSAWAAGCWARPYQSLISKVVPANKLGTYSGVFNSSRGFISLPAPWLGAQLWERFSPRTPFIITAMATFLIVIPIYFKFKAPEKPLDMSEPVLVETGE